MVSTLDFESSDPGSNPGRSYVWHLQVLLLTVRILVSERANLMAYSVVARFDKDMVV